MKEFMAHILVILISILELFAIGGCHKENKVKGEQYDAWIIFEESLYIKNEEDTYIKADFPMDLSEALRENERIFFKKEENILVARCQKEFLIYNFKNDTLSKMCIEGECAGWDIFNKQIYYIESDGQTNNQLKCYDIQTEVTSYIDLGDFVPMQFIIRDDGAIGILGVSGKLESGIRDVCFVENGQITCLSLNDDVFGWVHLMEFNEKGIIFQKEYPTSTGNGTKLYCYNKDGTCSIMARLSENPIEMNPIPEGPLVFLSNQILEIDMKNGGVESYDYLFKRQGTLEWENKSEFVEDLDFRGFWVENEKVYGIWGDEENTCLRVFGLCEKTQYCVIKQ